jgi:hypothetical protein
VRASILALCVCDVRVRVRDVSVRVQSDMNVYDLVDWMMTDALHRRSTFIGIFALTNIPQSYFLYRCAVRTCNRLLRACARCLIECHEC